MTYMEIKAKAEKLRKVSEEIKKLQSIEDELKKAFQDEMLKTGESTITAGKLIVKWTPYMENRFDSTKFRKEHEKLYKRYVKESERRRFSIVENTQPEKVVAKGKATSVA